MHGSTGAMIVPVPQIPVSYENTFLFETIVNSCVEIM